MKTTRIAAATVLSIAAVSAATSTPTSVDAHPTYRHIAPQGRHLSARLDAAVRRTAGSRAFSGVVLVQQGGSIVLRKAYGTGAGNNTINATFALPGVTQLFTAAAIEQLAEHGKIDSRVMTDTLTHQNASGQRAAIQLIERVSGESYDVYLQSHMFQPLDMTHTTIRQSSTDLPEVYSTVDELNRWDQSVLDCGLISPESLFRTLTKDGDVFQASGVQIGAAAGERLFLSSRTTIIVLANSGKSIDQLLNVLQNIAVPSQSAAAATAAM